MSHMNEIIQKNIDFVNIYNKSYRLAAAVFMISNVMDQDEELRTKIKNLSLELVSMSVNLKDTDFGYAKKLTEKFEDHKNLSVRGIFEQPQTLNINDNLGKTNFGYGIKDNLLYGGEMRNMQ